MTDGNKLSSWSQILLAVVLVGLVGGAFWLKSRPKIPIGATADLESVSSILEQGIQAHNAQQYEQAVELYHRVLAQDPGHPVAHYNLGQIYTVQGQPTKAQWEYEAVLRTDPSHLDATLNLGVALYRQRKFQEAAEASRRALTLSPRHPMALFNLGVTLLEMGQPDQAITWLTAALQEDQKRADTHYYLGHAYLKQQRVAEAKRSLEKAIELNPDLQMAHLTLAKLARQQGDPKGVQEALKGVTGLPPGQKR